MNVNIYNECACDLWNITGNFGKITEEEIVERSNSFIAENEKIKVISEITKDENGVCIRKGKVKNISKEEIVLNTLFTNFSLHNGEYEVYTQYNGWQNESLGGWQPLVTSIRSCSESVRNAYNATPFMVLWNNQVNRGVAFHLIAYSAWEMRASRVYSVGGAASVKLEFGVQSDGLNLTLAPNEEVELPEVIYYDVLNKADMDCWKLHTYLNKKFPRKTMPVIYNSWLYKFDKFTYDDIVKQMSKAKELGVEYFVVDAGWFGKDESWFSARGDWEENPKCGFKGRMREIADEVRQHDMKFGFWLEPESAALQSGIVKEYPEYFLRGKKSYFIDFANQDAFDYIFHKTCELIDRYSAEFVKFDFNADLKFDESRSGFIKYFDGYVKFIKGIKEKYPNLYIENCASGGMRMTVRDGIMFDSFWLTDNQNLYDSLRIFKDTLRRMPPQWIERWAAICSVNIQNQNQIISTGDAEWTYVTGTNQSFLKGFLTGGPIGLSFDLTGLSIDVFDELKKLISQFKENRDFWQNAVCHILTDTKTMLVLEYRNNDFSRVEIVAISHKSLQNNICVFPVLNEDYDYVVSGEEQKSAREIFEEGIIVPVQGCYRAEFLSLEKIDRGETQYRK